MERGAGQLEQALGQTAQGAPQVPRPGPSVKARAPHEGGAGGYLGMGAYPVQLPERLAEAYGTPGGLILLSVEPGGPADQAGLQLGDTLLRLEEKPLLDVGDLVAQLSPEHVGQSMHAKVLRAGVAQDVTLTVGERP